MYYILAIILFRVLIRWCKHQQQHNLTCLDLTDCHPNIDRKRPRRFIVSKDFIHDLALRSKGDNVVKRQYSETCYQLSKESLKHTRHSSSIYLGKTNYIYCYGCSRPTNRIHANYVYSCFKCGRQFSKSRQLSTDLNGRICLVTGGRTKLGHQVVMKLIRAGATVVVTTRRPSDALDLFKNYPDYNEWRNQLDVYPKSIDLDSSNILDIVCNIRNYIEKKYNKLDILINCAAQTIRSRDKPTDHIDIDEVNRYKDPKYVSNHMTNSWQMTIDDIDQGEMEEVYRVNAIGPLLIVKTFVPLLQLSTHRPFIINVHAREGIFNVHKSRYHIHLNMAKAGLHMLTNCLVSCKLKTHTGQTFSIHGCDPGWISVDEYYEHNRPWIVPPLDEIDGASRIVYPIFKDLISCRLTRRHYRNLVN